AIEPHLTHDGLDDLGALHRQNRVQQRGKKQIHRRPRQQHGDALCDRSAREGTVQLRGRDIAFALVEELDVAAQRNGRDAVLGPVRIPPSAHEQGFAESDAEAQHLEAELLGDPVMPELVNGDQYPDRNQKGGEKNQHLHARTPCAGSIIASAARRAAASASSTSPSALTGRDSSRCITLSMTAAIPVKFKRRSRNACTATSFAALSMAGAVPPALAAALASPR